MNTIHAMPRSGRGRLSRKAGGKPYSSTRRRSAGYPHLPQAQLQLFAALLGALFAAISNLFAGPHRYLHNKQGRSQRRQMRILPMLISCMLLGSAAAQESGGGQAEARQLASVLVVGDTLPASFWAQEYSFLQGKQAVVANLEAYRGKWLLLDFWATWCTVCLQRFPEVDSLRHALRDKLEVILVNKESRPDIEEHVSGFLERHAAAYTYGLDMPRIIRGDGLKDYFPHQVNPYYVLINDEGIVLSLGSATSYNAVRAMLHMLAHAAEGRGR